MRGSKGLILGFCCLIHQFCFPLFYFSFIDFNAGIKQFMVLIL